MIITDDTFDGMIRENKIILVDFWADWCGPCKKVAPILDEISNETGLLIGKLNVDENTEKSREYSIQSIPSMVLFVDGKPVHTIVGAMPKHMIMKELQPWI